MSDVWLINRRHYLMLKVIISIPPVTFSIERHRQVRLDEFIWGKIWICKFGSYFPWPFKAVLLGMGHRSAVFTSPCQWTFLWHWSSEKRFKFDKPFLYFVEIDLMSTPLWYHSFRLENFFIFSSCWRWCFKVGPLGSKYQGASEMYYKNWISTPLRENFKLRVKIDKKKRCYLWNVRVDIFAFFVNSSRSITKFTVSNIKSFNESEYIF